jgi:hypothetical protein
MKKFFAFDPKVSTDAIEIENPCTENFGLTEVAVPAIAGLLGSVGVGASTATALSSGLVNAGIGAGLGAITGNPGMGAALGGINGLIGMGGGALSNALGLGGGGGTPGALTAANMMGSVAGGGGPQPVNITPAANSGMVAGNPTGGAGGASQIGNQGISGALSTAAGSNARGLGGGGGPLAILAALAQAANRPSTTATPPPGFSDPYNPSGYINRTQTPNYQPNSGSYYTYGAQGNPQFFTGNQIHLAKGGALSRARPIKMAAGGSTVGQVQGASDPISNRVESMYLNYGLPALTAISPVAGTIAGAAQPAIDTARGNQSYTSSPNGSWTLPNPGAALGQAGNWLAGLFNGNTSGMTNATSTGMGGGGGGGWMSGIFGGGPTSMTNSNMTGGSIGSFNGPMSYGGMGTTGAGNMGSVGSGGFSGSGPSSGGGFMEDIGGFLNSIGLSHGGALSHAMMARRLASGGRPVSTADGVHYLHGGEGGQDDTEPARLSDGEFVMDATTVSKLGDGNSNAGARKMNEIRHLIANDARSKGVVQHKTRSPLEYVRKVA